MRPRSQGRLWREARDPSDRRTEPDGWGTLLLEQIPQLRECDRAQLLCAQFEGLLAWWVWAYPPWPVYA